MVLSLLFNSINISLRYSLIYRSKSSEVWIDLDNHFYQSNHPYLYHLHCGLANLKQGTMSITTYYNTIKDFWDELTDVA